MFTIKNIFYSISLHYLKQIHKKNRSMLIHHGRLGSIANFSNICLHPNISNYVNSYLIDCRNHGQSPHTQTHTMQNLADDIYDFIIQKQKTCYQSNWKKIILMGHSMGGIALMEFTRKYPQMQKYVEEIIIIDVPCSKLRNRPTWPAFKEMFINMNKIPLSLDRNKIQEKIDEYALNSEIGNLFKINLATTKAGSKWIPNLPVLVKDYEELGNFQLTKNQWEKPVNVIYGSQSLQINQVQIENFIKGYPQMSQERNFHKIEGAGHWVHFDKPKEFLDIMKKILERGQG